LIAVFDTHCHLHDDRLYPDQAEAMARARAAGVRRVLLAGVQPEGWAREIELAAEHPELVLSFGVHPQLVAELDERAALAMVDALDRELCKAPRHPALVAVGEIGLDALGDRRETLALQERVFRAQLKLARAHDLPVCLHVLRAHDRALAILKAEALPSRPGAVHSYSGSAEQVPAYLALGFHLSFAGPVTWKQSSKTRAAVLRVPRERLLAETDAPDQTPEPHRPGRNEPAFLVANLHALAQIRGESPADVAAYTDENARNLFGVSA
jgi:TatD DNase family protein